MVAAEGRSSVGRALVSKTRCRRFESCRPCSEADSLLSDARMRLRPAEPALRGRPLCETHGSTPGTAAAAGDAPWQPQAIRLGFHDLRRARNFRECLDRDSYVTSQALAEQLLEDGSLGVIYPSVRRAGGTCVACFRPALVSNVRRARSYRFTWAGTPTPTVTMGR